MTDYTDERLAPDQRTLLEAHLKNCPACRNFAASMKETAGVFASVKPVSLDRDKIWQKIIDDIEQEKTPSMIYEPLRQVSILDKIFRAVKPSYVLVSAAIVIVITTFYFQRLPVETAKNQEKEDQVEYLVSVVDEVASLDESEGEGFGTSIEEYFL